MRKFVPRVDILPDAQKSIWEELAFCAEKEFVLYGGTALALQLGHRTSIDFDFFSSSPLDEKKVREIKGRPLLRNSTIIQHEENTFSILTKGGVQISFFGNINFGRVDEPAMTDDNVLCVASLRDIMGTKLATLFNRVQVKDYKDVAALIRHGLDLNQGLGAAAALYKDSFPPAECLRAMVFFQGDEFSALPRADREILVEAVRGAGSQTLPRVEIISETLHVKRQPSAGMAPFPDAVDPEDCARFIFEQGLDPRDEAGEIERRWGAEAKPLIKTHLSSIAGNPDLYGYDAGQTEAWGGKFNLGRVRMLPGENGPYQVITYDDF
jgi:hypothetical protein